MGQYRQALLAAGLIFISTETFAAPPIMDGTFIIESSTSCQYEISAPTAPNPDRVTSVFMAMSLPANSKTLSF